MMKYIVYCRKSTDEPDKQILSIDAQIEELKEFAVKEKLDIVYFLTEAKTARKPGREKFEQLFKLIEKGEANGILAWHPDRLARNTIDGGKLVYLLDTEKLQSLKFPTFWFENTPQGRFMLNIAFGQAKYFVDNLSENVKRGIRHKLRNGVYPNKAPLGYLNEPQKRTIEVDPKTARYVKKAFQLFATGTYSYVAIQKFFFQNGIKEKTEKPLYMDKIIRTLKNPFYYGLISFAGEIYQGAHKPLITKSLFEKCRDVLLKRAKPQGNNEHQFSFLGLAKCSECQSAITAEKHERFYPRIKRKVRYDYYRCGKKHGFCSQMYVPAEDFEKQIRDIIFGVSLHEANAIWLLNKLKHDETTEKQSGSKNVKFLKDKLQDINERLERLLDAYLNQLIDVNEYQIVKKKLLDEKVTIEEKLLQIRKSGSEWVELVREFINGAAEGQKIARAKKNRHDLAIMAKKVGSNYFLKDRRLAVSYEIAPKLLAEFAPSASRPLAFHDLCRGCESNTYIVFFRHAP